MPQLPIHQRNHNLEVMAKLLNSAAVKYDCRVKYDKVLDRLTFRGDESLRRAIVEETAGYFNNR
ncbi:MAG: hypothetical protein PVH30_03715 [Desulfobacterales bacterium]|jgi:hypothetical protein